MTEEFVDRIYPTIVLGNHKKKLRYKTLAVDCATINQYFFEYLNTYNIPTAFQEKVDEKTLRFTPVEVVPFFIRIVNHIDGHFSRILGKTLWETYSIPVLEYYTLPPTQNMISLNHIVATGMLGVEDVKFLNRLCTKMNALLKSFFERREQLLLSVDCFFGKNNDKFVLCGEFDPLHLRIIGKNDVLTVSEDETYPDKSSQLRKNVENLLTIIRT